jgi:biopolymer transport protein ExbD
MSRFYAVPHEDQTEINLSPMLDMVFILLIFFIVVASFVDEDVLPVTLPGGMTFPEGVESITVVVEPASTFVVNGRAMSSSSVAPYVQALHAENPEAGFGVVFAKGSKVKDAAVAIEAGRSAGFDVVPVTRE